MWGFSFFSSDSDGAEALASRVSSSTNPVSTFVLLISLLYFSNLLSRTTWSRHSLPSLWPQLISNFCVSEQRSFRWIVFKRISLRIIYFVELFRTQRAFWKMVKQTVSFLFTGKIPFEIYRENISTMTSMFLKIVWGKNILKDNLRRFFFVPTSNNEVSAWVSS